MKNTDKHHVYRICTNCGYFKPKDPTLADEYCTRCGQRLYSHCQTCQFEITDPFAKYCRRCGYNVQLKNKKKETNKMIVNLKKKTLCVFIPFLSITMLSGENYKLKHYVISSSAIIAENQNYRINASLGQPIVSGSQSTNFNLNAGFWNTVTKNYLFVDENQFIPYQFEIKSAYPNPFNPVTQINFTIPTEGVVETKIYDITGRMIVHESRNYSNPGVFQYRWNGTDKNSNHISSGIYFITISHNNNSQTQKLTLIK